MPGWFDTPDEKPAQRNLDFQNNLQTITPHPAKPTHPFPSQSEGTRTSEARQEGMHESKPPSNSHSPYPGVSPIQTSPPSKYSFFQIGTTSFNRSMKYSDDSNAGRRCAALTANTMLVCPISTRPVR